ncbi:MAG TPA: FtsX-like permease family protein [Rhizomicrobium sp.]|nr:FtsX-like permease family protein [Rhizomicrobium sp.]
MSMIALAFAYLRRRWGQALLSVLVGALGIAAVGVAFAGLDALPEAAERSWGGVDLVIGPKGSALDLVLCCALHVSDPRGLVSEKTAMAAASHPLIRVAAPIALGDNVDGWRIVGTTPKLLWVYRADLAQGREWTKPLEAVLGAQAARALKLKLGAKFIGAHGLEAGGEMHSQFPYTVVGILAPTGSALDRMVLTDIETVRYIHKMHQEDEAAETGVAETYVNLPDAATAVVASYKSPVAALLVPRLIERDPTLTAASPSFEIARLMSYLRPLTIAATALGLLLVAIAAAGAAASLMATMNARTRDLALLRALGAGPASLALVAVAESVMIALVAAAAGLMLTWLLLTIGAGLLADRTGLLLTPKIDPGDVVTIIAGALGVAILAALFPAIRAARTPIEELLQS